MENNVAHTNCREEEGITVGLIDALISISRILAKRDFSPLTVREALKDLSQDEDVARIVEESRKVHERV